MAKAIVINALRHADDRFVVSFDFLRSLGRLPNLRSPRTLNELLQVDKISVRDARLPLLVDKLRVKAHVADLLGPEWVTPTLWSGSHATAESLGAIRQPAVLKCNHASGMIEFLERGSNLAAIARRANGWLKLDYHLLQREWPYGQLERQLLIEPLIADRDRLMDFKFWCFGGRVAFVQVDVGRFERHVRQFYDPAWRRLPIAMNYPSDGLEVARPVALSRMIEAAEALSKDHAFVRVDLYDLASGPRFGELTFWPEGGLCRWLPSSMDEELGVRYVCAQSEVASRLGQAHVACGDEANDRHGIVAENAQ
ncbi:MAG: ATP-grasp fold amidoligase family protein [Hyphomonadaceae bacterium]